jgi:hypothetical protein
MQGANDMEWYQQSLTAAAPWSYVLLAGQIVLLASLIERSVFMLRARLNAPMFLDMVRKLVVAGNIDRARKLAQAPGEIPMGRVCRAGLAALGRGPFALREDLDRAIALEVPLVRRRLGSILLLALALGAVGVMGSWMLGARELAFGGDGPLPLGLGLELAPALLGVGSAVVGLLAWISLSSKAKTVLAGLEMCKEVLLELGPQVTQAAQAAQGM